MRIKDLYTIALMHYSGLEGIKSINEHGAFEFTYEGPQAQDIINLAEEGQLQVNYRDYITSVKIIKNKIRR